MPDLVPDVKGLRAIQSVAQDWHMRSPELKAILAEAGVGTVTLSVSGRRVELVSETQANAAVARRLLPDQTDPPEGEAATYTPMMDRLDAQGRELKALRAKLAAIEAGLRGGA